MLLSTAYFPPVEYFALMAECSSVYIEACENYQKQSYRNRCKFYAENGVQTLSVPIVHEGGQYELPIRKIKVDYSTPWLLRSERAIESAYHSSAFFDYYRDSLFEVLERRPETLFEFNLNIIEYLISKLGLRTEILFTEDFYPDSGPYGPDFRGIIHPKKDNTILEDRGLKKPYFQVFAQKHGFISNLSAMDLLFNEGPDSISYLRTSIRR